MTQCSHRWRRYRALLSCGGNRRRRYRACSSGLRGASPSNPGLFGGQCCPASKLVKKRKHCSKAEPTAAQTTIPHGTSRSTPSGPLRRTLFSFTFFTIVFVRISMSDSLNVRSVYAISSLLNEGSTLGRASTSVMRMREASSGYHDLRSSLKLIEI